MSRQYRVCVVTGTRAEYGILKNLINKIREDDILQLQLIVTGAHLSPEFGLTYKEIEEDGIPMDWQVEMLMASDSSCGVAKSMGVGMIGFAEAYGHLKPDIVVLTGDRYEMLAAAGAALVYRIPIAHIHGGELTQGAVDEAVRHAVTKMGILHFTSTQTYRKRVIQLGEQPECVFNVGALGVENIKEWKLFGREQLKEALGMEVDTDTAMVTYHPATLDNKSVEEQIDSLLHVLKKETALKLVFTKANADMGGKTVNDRIREFVRKESSRAVVVDSLGQAKYFSVLNCCGLVVGNSSSGIIEAPSFGIPTVNIGRRQEGRVRAGSVIDCGGSEAEIGEAISRALSGKMREYARRVRNPYEKEGTARRIVSILKESLEKGICLEKKFYDIPFQV